MQSDTSDFAAVADSIVEWFELRWRAIIYSFFAGCVFTLACAWCSEAHAAGYTKPAGAPEVYVPDHGVSVGVWAVQTAIGHGIGVFEKSGNDWVLCGICLVDASIPNLDANVSAAGGAGSYVVGKLPAINAVMAQRYPAVGGGPVSTLDAVNQALQGMGLRLVNGSPVLGPR